MAVVVEPSHDRYRRDAAQALGRVFRATRNARGASQEQVALAAGIAVYTYRCLEGGKSPGGGVANPTLNTLLRVMKALEVCPHRVLDDLGLAPQ